MGLIYWQWSDSREEKPKTQQPTDKARGFFSFTLFYNFIAMPSMETADLSASDRNETFLWTAKCFLPASLEIKLCMILLKFIIFFPLVEWFSGEIDTVSCTFLFWSSCHFLSWLMKGCVLCQGKYIDTSLLLAAKEGHKNFIKGNFYITASVLRKINPLI